MGDDLDNWTTVKRRLDAAPNILTFKTREIWWCSLGKNIGHEQDGKRALFNRPVLIVRKMNYRLFWGVPLTTQIKDNPHYYPFRFDDRDQCAMLTQLRLWDAKRITHKMGRLHEREYKSICQALKNYLL